MLKKTIALSLLLGSTTLSATENSLHGEILLGSANHEVSASGFEPVGGDSTSFGIRGVYGLNDHFAVEAAYHVYGETDEVTLDDFDDRVREEVRTTAFNLGIKGILPITDKFSFNGRLGVSDWNTTITVTELDFDDDSFNFNRNGTDIYYGVGAQYDISSQFYIGAEYTLTKAKLPTFIGNADFDVKNLSLSLGFKL